jgi:tRNA(fMet)-specific endonuclease VapC
MGLILDSSVLIAVERQGRYAGQMLTAIAGMIGDTEVGISVVALVELAHGAARANTPGRNAKCWNFIGELVTATPIHPVTVSLVLWAGQLDGGSQAQGIQNPLSDRLIGVTAFELDYSVGMADRRHFSRVLGHSVVQL